MVLGWAGLRLGLSHRQGAIALARSAAAASSPEVLHVQIYSFHPRPSVCVCVCVCGEEPNRMIGNPIFAEHRGSTTVNLEKIPNTQV